MYKASLLEFDCQLQNALLELEDNLVARNQFFGEDSALIYINGGVASIIKNKFSYSGALHKNIKPMKKYQKQQFLRS